MQRLKDTSAGQDGLAESGSKYYGPQDRSGSPLRVSDGSVGPSSVLTDPGVSEAIWDTVPMGEGQGPVASSPALPDRLGDTGPEPPPFLIDEVKSGAQGRVRTYGERIARARVRGKGLLKRPEPDAQKAGQALLECGSVLWFRHYPTAPEKCDRLAKMFACQQVYLCPFCASRMSAVHLRRASAKVLSVLQQRPDLAAYLGTFTIETGPDIRLQANRLWAAWSKVVEGRRSWLKFVANAERRRQRWSPFAEFEGGIIRGEVKRSGGDRSKWHYHAHAILLGRRGLTHGEVMPAGAENVSWGSGDRRPLFWRYEAPWGERTYAAGELAEEWRRCCGLPDGNCDFRELQSSIRIEDGAGLEETRDQLIDELQETFCYVLKVADFSEDDLWDAHTGLRKRPRLQQQRAFGCLRAVNLDPAFTDDLDDCEGLPFEELCYRYLEQEGCYQQVKREEALPRWSEFDAFA